MMPVPPPHGPATTAAQAPGRNRRSPRSWLARLACLSMLLMGLQPVWGAPPRGDKIAVIAPADTPDLAFDQLTLRDIFLKRITIDRQGHALIPLNLPPDHPLRRAFSIALLGQSTRALQSYWNQRYFHGVSPPYVMNSQEAVVRFVAKTAGAIGYVATCQMDDKVRQVALIPVPPPLQKAVQALCPPPPKDQK